MTTQAEEEFTELVAADFSKMALVGAGANGVPRFLVMKDAEGGSGLLEPDFVRDLISKADQEPGSQEGNVTMTGSPAAIAALIHNASVAKEKLSSADKNDLPDSAFAYIQPGGKKDADGKTTPRSLRHFPIHDEAHVRAALSRIGEGAEYSKEASPKVHAAAKRMGIKVTKKEADAIAKALAAIEKADAIAKALAAIEKADAGDMLDAQTDDGVDGLDPTVPLAAPDDDAPGDPTDPGSPAWEAIDAATAQKWCSILSRAEVALELLSERELLEAASADPDDAENAWDLSDACCAIDYVISVLAPYAVAEQSEADCGADDLAAIGKAMAGAEEPLSAVEAYAAVMKAGRVLSSANETLIRTAGESLQKVLASLPQAPLADDTVTKETAVDDGQTKPGEPEGVAKDAANADPATEPETVAKDAQEPAEPQDGVAKADAASGDGKPTMQAVFDQKGNLIGIVDPSAITPVAGADGNAPAEAPKDDAGPDADTAPAADPADLTPAPAGETGTPADDVTKAEQAQPVAKGDDEEDPQAVLKSIVVTAMNEVLGGDPAKEDIRKQADVIAKQSQEIEALKARLETVENTPAMPKVFTSGATPPPGTLRGQDAGAAAQVDVAKAKELKDTLYHGDPADQNKAFTELQQSSIASLAAIHAGRR